MRRLEGFHGGPALPPHLGHLQTAGTMGALSGEQSGLTTKSRNPASLSRVAAGSATFTVGAFLVQQSGDVAGPACISRRQTSPRAAEDTALHRLVLA